MTTAPLPTSSLPYLTVEQLAGIMHAGLGTLGPVDYYPQGCMTCARAENWHAALEADGWRRPLPPPPNTVEGTITLEDGSISQVLLSEYGYQQWGANTERLGRSQPIAEALAKAYIESKEEQ